MTWVKNQLNQFYKSMLLQKWKRIIASLIFFRLDFSNNKFLVQDTARLYFKQMSFEACKVTILVQHYYLNCNCDLSWLSQFWEVGKRYPLPERFVIFPATIWKKGDWGKYKLQLWWGWFGQGNHGHVTIFCFKIMIIIVL